MTDTGMIEKVLDLLVRRMDAQDQMISTQTDSIGSINDNLSGIRETLSKLEFHDERLHEHRQDISSLQKRIDIVESDRDKNITVMDILNRTLRVGVPAIIFIALSMAGMLWYGIEKNKGQGMSQQDLQNIAVIIAETIKASDKN